MYITKRFIAALVCAVLFATTGAGQAAERLRLATTTSTEHSGLLGKLNPVFEHEYGVEVDVIAVGTGKALKLGENGDVDLVLVHAPEAERAFVEAGHGVRRTPVMHNDFVLVGPAADPARAREADSAAQALVRIARARASFVSRGDDSGTHKKELALWAGAGLQPQGSWYLAIGQGMGVVLQVADDKRAYTLTDRGTLLAYRGRIELAVLYAGDPQLYNPYHVIIVNPARHPHAAYALAERYVEFLTGAQGRAIIDGFRVGGEQLFFAHAPAGER